MAYLFEEEEETVTQTNESLATIQASPGGIVSLAPITINASVGGDVTGDTKDDLDITTPGSSGVINGAIFTDAVNVGSGTGNYNTFLAIGDKVGADDIAAGFNTIDGPPGGPDASNAEIDHAKTEAVLLGAVPVTEVDGVLYYEFRVDLNEANSGIVAQISLDQFQIYVSTDGGITELSVLTSQIKVYDMDAGPDGDVSVLFDEANSSGSGTDDYAVLVPAALFSSFNPTTYYLYLYVEMGAAGADWGVQSGFEEWNIANAVILQGNKFEDTNGNGVQDGGEEGIEGVLIYIDENKDGLFNYTDVDLSGDFNEGDIALERWTLTDADGNYFFGSVALGESDFTLWIDEVVPDGYVQTTGPYEEVFVDSKSDPGTILIVDPIGNRPLTPSILIVKDVDYLIDNPLDPGTDGNDGAGDKIVYTISVTNNGELALTNVVVTDPNADVGSITYLSGDTGNDGIMDVGETWLYSAVHTITQAEIDGKGSDATGAIDGDTDIDNVASVTADSARGSVNDSDPAEQPIQYLPNFSVLKAVTSITDGDDFGGTGQADSAGDVINYLITVTNTGQVTLTNFMYTDANADGDTITVSTNGNGDANLDVGETWTFTATHTVTQAELDSPGSDYTGALDMDGDVDNKVVVTFDEAGPKDSSVETDLYYAPDFTVKKEVTSITDDDDFGAENQADSAGDVIHYLITVVNTGNITLTNFTYDDQNADGDMIIVATNGNGDANLDVGETWTFTATHTVTQDELNNPGSDETGALDTDGDVDNWVTVDFEEAGPKTGKVETPLIYIAAIGLEKYVSVNPGDGYIDWVEADNPMGPVTSYLSDALFFVEVINEGTVTLTGLTFADQLTSPVAMPVDLDYAALGAMVDTNGDGIVDESFADLDAADGTTDGTLGTLVLQPGDAIGIYYALPFAQGQHTNIAYVSSDQTGTYDDPANYYGLVNDGEGVRTPGFWQNENNGLTFWDGIDGNEAHSGEGFPEQDLLYDVYVEDTNGDGFINYDDDPTKGLLVGDWNRDGLSNPLEDTIFIPYDVAVALVSSGGGNDGGEKIGRDVVATWLNWLNGNSLGEASDPGSPRSYMEEAIDWLQEFVSDEHDADINFANFLDNGTIKSNSKPWKVGVDNDGPSGSEIHQALDSYNNDGTIAGIEYAGDADNEAFIYALENLSIVQPMEEYAKFEDSGLGNDLMPILDMAEVALLA